MKLLSELNRRNVFRVSIAYIVAAWVIAQVADLVLENIGAPQWVMQSLLLILAIGFFVAAIIAWAFEVTPEGIKRDGDVAVDEQTTQRTATRLNLVTIVLVLMALGLLAFDRLGGNGSPNNVLQQESAPEISSPAPVNPIELDSDSTPVVGVLPFLATGSEDGGFLAGGLHDDLLTRLAKLDAFRVISRTSMMEYAGTSKNMREIGEEIGATYILEGGVQARGNRVRVNAQLIESTADEHVWAETYDRELTAANLFDIQSELAYAIAEQMHTVLSESDQSLIDQVPTQNMEAYSAYLRGLELRESGGHNVRIVTANIEAFEQATTLDPEFALAWAQLSREYSRLAQGSADPEHRQAALMAINRAKELQPDLFEAEVAQVEYLYRAEFEYQLALDHLLALERRHTLNTSAMLLKAFLVRRLGDFETAYQITLTAQKLDPRNLQVASQLINMAWETGDCDAASAHAQAALALSPEALVIRTPMALMEMQCNGNSQLANDLMMGADFNGFYQAQIAQTAALAARDWQTALVVSQYPLPQEGPLNDVFNLLESVTVLRHLDRDVEAMAALNAASEALNSLAEVKPVSDSYLFAMARGFYSALKQEPVATREWIAEAKRRLEINSKGDVALKRGFFRYHAESFTIAGLYPDAIEELRLSLSLPGGDRFPFIDSLPVFDVLKQEPGYLELKQQYGSE
ncbi:MAG TPA: hypothetical protein VJ984_06160 [Xanthomonadales bacterium]|nr:hypothetical protein [Xanthomonadales bacterium]